MGVWGLGFGVWGLGFGLGIRVLPGGRESESLGFCGVTFTRRFGSWKMKFAA